MNVSERNESVPVRKADFKQKYRCKYRGDQWQRDTTDTAESVF